MTPGFCRFILKTFGWTTIGEKVEERTCIFLEAPHTSIWDFLIGYLYYRSKGGRLRTMIKKEAFFFPFRYLLRAMGGFPIDRKSPAATIRSIVTEMERSSDKPFHLVMCPEGTRKAVHKWKTGYHTIARETGAPVYLTMIDWGHKRVGIMQRFDIGDDPRADTDMIQKIYREADVVGLHPEGFTTE